MSSPRSRPGEGAYPPLPQRTGPLPTDGVVGSAVRRFVLISIGALALLLAVGLWTSAALARDEHLHEARTHSEALAQLVISTGLSSGSVPVAGAEQRRLDRFVGSLVDGGTIRRIKLWSQDGTILWSDEAELIGRTFPLDPDVAALFGTDNVVSEVSDLDDPENELERGQDQLLEVYAGSVADDGRPVVLEAYFSTQSLERSSQTFAVALVAVALVVLVLFGAALVPLALSLAVRVKRAGERNARLVSNSLRASELERRRLSQTLHDDVIPELAGLGYLTSLVEQSLDEGNVGTARDRLVDMDELLRRGQSALRTALLGIYPPDLELDGLAAALQDLADDVRRQGGLDIEVVVHTDLEPDLDVARLAHRIAREGLRNAHRHARAARVRISVDVDADRLIVSVVDDGVGPPDVPGGDEQLGIRLLEETIRDLGGTLVLGRSDRPGLAGAELLVEVPLPLTAS